MELGNGSGKKQNGDSGLILPGGGNEMASASIEPGSIPEQTEETEVVVSKIEITTDATVSEMESVVTSEKLTEGKSNMNDIVLSFWHGVATVLIGETVALMVAVAWMKIRGGK